MFVLPSGCTSFYVLHAGLSFSGGAFLPLLHYRPPFCTPTLHFSFTLRRGFSSSPSPPPRFFALRLSTSPSLSGGAFLPFFTSAPPFCTPVLHFVFLLRRGFSPSPSLPSPFLHADFALLLHSPAGLFFLSFTTDPLFCTPALHFTFLLRRGFSPSPSLPPPFLHAGFALRLPFPAVLFFRFFARQYANGMWHTARPHIPLTFASKRTIDNKYKIT